MTTSVLFGRIEPGAQLGHRQLAKSQVLGYIRAAMRTIAGTGHGLGEPLPGTGHSLGLEPGAFAAVMCDERAGRSVSSQR